MNKSAPHPMFKLATEMGPLVVFFAANAKFGSVRRDGRVHGGDRRRARSHLMW